MRRGSRVGAGLSALLLVVSALSVNALTAGIEIAPPAIGRPAFPGNAQFGLALRDRIPRAAFGEVPVFARGPAAFGGDRVYDIDVDGTSYRVHEFTAVGSATLTVTRELQVQYVVVGGGGGGGAHVGGGGGGGGMLTGAATLTGDTSVEVGGGGAGAEHLGQRNNTEVNFATSGDSSRLGAFEAAGGGHGGSWDWQVAASGGSGGGSGTSSPGGSGTSQQGSAGGTGRGSNENGYPTGGGGGAGGSGADWRSTSSGDGGVGRSSSITGQEVRYGGGGGGGVHGRNDGVNAAPGAGRDGGGQGVAVQTTRQSQQNGTSGLGGGGGGGGAPSTVPSAGGNGGSGIVIVRYEIPRTVWAPVAATGGDITHYVADGTNGDAGVRYRIHTFTSSGTFDVTDPGVSSTVDVLLVGGGGGGGSRHGGGGGGGGVREVPAQSLTSGSHAVTVGQGGVGMTTSTDGANGGPSVFLGLTAQGGGRGAGVKHVAGTGSGVGSGGGGSDSNSVVGGGAAGQGNAGAVGVSGTGTGDREGGWAGGGGGGAGQAGDPPTGGGAARDATGGKGGDGRVSTMNGSEVHYGGGGGGAMSHLSTGTAGPGGQGGGGAGGTLGWDFFTHGLTDHPRVVGDFDELFKVEKRLSLGNVFNSVASGFATSAGGIAPGTSRDLSHGPPNVLNWRGSSGSCPSLGCELYAVIPVQQPLGGGSAIGDRFAFRVSGTFVPNATGYYRFTADSDDGVDVVIGGERLAFFYGGRGFQNLSDGTRTAASGQLTVHASEPKLLTAGQPYRFVARMHEIAGGDGLRVFWSRSDSPTLAPVAEWFQYEGELSGSGRDGIDGLGGGGGGGGFSGGDNGPGGRGGDGVVIIRYPLDRIVDALPSEVREAVAGEGATSAVLRWREPASAAPPASTLGYRIEYSPAGGGSWVTIDDQGDVGFASSGEMVTANLTGIPSASRHRFRITPIGSVDGPSTVVEPVAKGGDNVTLVGDDVVHTYTTVGSGNFRLREPRTASILVVGGGGGGGGTSWGGGGGGGRVLSGVGVALTPSDAIPVTVGAGGSGGQNIPATPSARSGSNGGQSAFGTVVAPGGGGGGGAGWELPTYTGRGSDGGSGGGTGEHGTNIQRSGQLIYATTNPTRSASAIVYTSGFGNGASDAAATFDNSSTSITTVTYRMEVSVADVARFAEVRFDAWSGLTARDLRVPDLASGNVFTLRRFVENMSVDSNMAADVSAKSQGVVTGTGRTGYLEIWPTDYAAGTRSDGPSGASGTLYDFNDTQSAGGNYGSFQVHDVTTPGSGSTVLAWNRHADSSAEVGLGNHKGTHPDWTFSQLNSLRTATSTPWKLEIRVNKDPIREVSGGAAAATAPPTPWSSFGNAGGSVSVVASQAGSGGGGAGGAGDSVPDTSNRAVNGVSQPRVAGNGGAGRMFTLSGTSTEYGGGGGGATVNSDGAVCSQGGSGGGGRGACSGSGGASAAAGTNGRGGGGGGGHDAAGAAGGSGTVIVRYPFSAALYSFESFTFTNGTQTGRAGPSRANLLAAYDAAANPWLNDTAFFNVAGGIQEWTVPADGRYRIEAFGAQGAGFGGSNGGRGARMTGDFDLTKGEVIRILVGQQSPPNAGRIDLSSPGGGGTFVVRTPYETNESILVIAGGGGGTGNERPLTSNGTTSVTGQTGSHGSGGTDGSGGTSGVSTAGAGGGFFTNGQTSGASGGSAFVNGGIGGTVSSSWNENGGGFGGGGSITSGGNSRYGGGGGYSGGSGSSHQSGVTTGFWGGGGGSFNSGTNQDNTPGANSGHGKVVISRQ